jgi:hypothetical protein
MSDRLTKQQLQRFHKIFSNEDSFLLIRSTPLYFEIFWMIAMMDPDGTIFPLLSLHLYEDLIRYVIKGLFLDNPSFDQQRSLNKSMTLLVDRFPQVEIERPEIFELCRRCLSPKEGYQDIELDHILIMDNIFRYINSNSSDVGEAHNAGQHGCDGTLTDASIDSIREFVISCVDLVGMIVIDLLSGNGYTIGRILDGLCPDIILANDITAYERRTSRPLEVFISDVITFLFSIANTQDTRRRVFFITSPPPGINGGVAVLAITMIARLFPPGTLLFVSGELGASDGIEGFYGFLMRSPYLELLDTKVINNDRFCAKTSYSFVVVQCARDTMDAYDGDIYEAITRIHSSRTQCVCGNTSNLKSCARCHKQVYCSKECQKDHWRTHKKVCEKNV